MKMRVLIFGLVIILLPLQSKLVKADDWDLSKAKSVPVSEHIQKWCKTEVNLVRYSNTEVAGYQPCGELKTIVVCDASGKKLISSGTPPYGYKECSTTPRIFVERIGPPIAEKKLEEEKSISLAKNEPVSPTDQITTGLKTYQDYITSLDQLTDEKPSQKKKQSKIGLSSLSSLTSNISPAMLQEVMKMLSQGH